jgi:hypothetical protein
MKLLVATEFPPNASGGGPAVVRQMLQGWPAKDLFWWSCLPERDSRFGQRVKATFCATIPPKLMPHRRLTRAKAALLERWWSPCATLHLARTIRRVQPDAVWVIPHNWSILPPSAVLPTAGIGFHVTVQDYVDVHGQLQKFGPSRCGRMAELSDHLYATATTRDATSHPMIEDLHNRTGVEAAQMLHAGLEEEDFRFLESNTPSCASEIRIAYAGTILASREFALFVESVSRLRSILPMPVSLDLFGAHSYASEQWFDQSWVREHGDLPEPELLKSLRACTWGFAPMALSDSNPRYNHFSFPTKFISYLMAGLPVITLGHPESSVMKMAERYRVGVASSAPDVGALMEELREPLADPAPWSRYATEIKRCARAEFDASRMRKILYECLDQCAKATRLQRPDRIRR